MTSAVVSPPSPQERAARRVEALFADVLGPMGVRVRRAADEPLDAAVLVVAPPPRWSCAWRWRSHCGQVLRSARVPVVVAASETTSAKSCLVVMRTDSTASDSLPRWLQAFDRVELALALDASSFALSVAGTPFPTALIGPAHGFPTFTEGRRPLPLRTLESLGDVRVSHHLGDVEGAVEAVARERCIDVVFLADARDLLFLGGALQLFVDRLGLSVIVPPARARDVGNVAAVP
jgi:hypothetical protein